MQDHRIIYKSTGEFLQFIYQKEKDAKKLNYLNLRAKPEKVFIQNDEDSQKGVVNA